jgi:anti-sigma B factor antagonist
MELSERELGDKRGDTVLVDVSGDIVGRGTDAPTEFLARVKHLLARGYKNILLNVAQVTYMDSVMLGALVQGYVSSAKQGSSLKLVEPPPRVRELLSVTKLDTVFEMLEAEAALQPFGGRPEPDTPR